MSEKETPEYKYCVIFFEKKRKERSTHQEKTFSDFDSEEQLFDQNLPKLL